MSFRAVEWIFAAEVGSGPPYSTFRGFTLSRMDEIDFRLEDGRVLHGYDSAPGDNDD